jgi:diguanylate cyclase (GGDEF)-like protein/PAS domain S-box-containing protein
MTGRLAGLADGQHGSTTADQRAALHEAHQRLHHHVEHGPLAVIEWDADLCVNRWSPGAERLFGWTANEAIGRQIGDDLPIFHHDEQVRRSRALARLLDGRDERNVDTGRSLTGDGRTIYCEWHNAALRDEAGRVVAAQSLVLDVTELVQLRGELARRESHDSPRGLPDRASLTERFSRLLAGEQRVATLFLNFDGFKAIVDRLGHAAGDELLAVIVRRLRNSVRAGDTIAWLGGDEFAILLDDVRDEAEAMGLARRLVAAVERPVALGGDRVCVTASVGVALAAPDRRDPDDLLLAADAAMHSAKQAGGGVLTAAPPPLAAPADQVRAD